MIESARSEELSITQSDSIVKVAAMDAIEARLREIDEEASRRWALLEPRHPRRPKSELEKSAIAALEAIKKKMAGVEGEIRTLRRAEKKLLRAKDLLRGKRR